MTQDEMVGWHHRLNGEEFEQIPGAGDGQGGLACCIPWGHKESDTTERLSIIAQRLRSLRTDPGGAGSQGREWGGGSGWEGGQ